MTDAAKALAIDCREDWRRWLRLHHRGAAEAWLVLYKGEARQGLSLDEAVEEALCFGWIDGKLKSLDRKRYLLRFTPRRQDSVWSVRNIRRATRLLREGKMTKAGFEKVAQARQNGQWQAALARERTDRLPPDLQAALRRRRGATEGCRRLRDSRKKQLLHHLSVARTSQTRRRRILAIVDEAARPAGA